MAKLKHRYQGEILVAGSGTLVRSLAEHDLVDEYRLIVHPVVLGHGKRLFPDGFPVTDLELAESRKVGPDVLLLIYHTATPTPATLTAAAPAVLVLVTQAWSRDGCAHMS